MGWTGRNGEGGVGDGRKGEEMEEERQGQVVKGWFFEQTK
jgi:hypothetical protein